VIAGLPDLRHGRNRKYHKHLRYLSNRRRKLSGS
jgi:hypothetical protein